MNDAFSSDFDPERLVADIAAIRTAHPGNLMARHFDAYYFRSLDAAAQRRLVAVIRSGIDNPDSQMGAYAQQSRDYRDFNTVLEPMIRDYHGIAEGAAIAQRHAWPKAGDSAGLDAIDPALGDVSMRVRVGRNLESFPLPGAMNRADRIAFESVMAAAFETLIGEASFGGQYLSLTPGSPYEIDADSYRDRVAAHQMFKDMSGDRYLASAGIAADWPYGRGMYVSAAEDFLVWVGEEDQLRIMAMKRDGNLAAMFGRLKDGLDRLEALLPAFAHLPEYGYLTSCPTNLGTAMRASLHMQLPRLTKNGADLAEVKKAATELQLSVRGAGGEHSDAGAGGLVDISPRARLGVSEAEIMDRLYTGAAALFGMETASS